MAWIGTNILKISEIYMVTVCLRVSAVIGVSQEDRIIGEGNNGVVADRLTEDVRKGVTT